VVFGAAFAGRPPDLRGVESIVGPFINNLPVRVAVASDAMADDFFRDVHTRILALTPYQYTPLMEIQRSSEMPWRYRLFESVVAFQNYAVDEAGQGFGGHIEIADFGKPRHTNYPVMLVATPTTGGVLQLDLAYDRQRMAQATIGRWGRDLTLLFEQLPFCLEKRVGELEGLLSSPVTAEAVAKRSPRTPSDSGIPRDMLEQLLTQLWKRILGVRHVGLGDDFFDLGGHSLAAVHLFSEIERLTGKNLPLATLFQASKLRELAEILRRDGWSPSWSSLVPINPGGSQVPLLLVHGAEGNVLLYRQLARYLGPDQPVYALQSQGLNGNGKIHTSVEEMASHYVSELRAIQPSGPYRLGGYCLGGAIALEMAQQLQAKGERVGLVAMLDTYNNNIFPGSKPPGLRFLRLLQNVWFHGANFYLAGNKDRWNFLREKWDVALTRSGIRLRALSHALHVGSSTKRQNGYPHLQVKRVNDQAASRYVPRPYSGRVVVIEPKTNFLGFDDPSLGWGGVVHDGLEIRKIPVYPKGMLVEPFVQMLAQELSIYLREAE
jgi:thioesterase domain-containing protein/acyl carrier protein